MKTLLNTGNTPKLYGADIDIKSDRYEVLKDSNCIAMCIYGDTCPRTK